LPHLALAESRVAGFDHGVLFALQRSLLRLLAARELEAILFELSKPIATEEAAEGTSRSLRRPFVRIPGLFQVLYRPSPTLYKDLLRVSRASVSEIATFEAFMDERLGATSLLDGLHRAAELVDIEIRDQRLLALNWLVVALGLLTIVLTAVQVAVALVTAG